MKRFILFITILCTVFSALVSQEYIDSSFTMNGDEKAYIFSADEYMRYDFNNDRTDPGYPKRVNYTSWPGVTFSKIDAALNWGNGKVYFFSANRYIRFDLARNSADSGYPKSINNNTWPGLTFSSVDAAVNGGNGKAYFFSGSKYIQYDIDSDKSDFSSPREIATFWRQVPFNKIDAALRIGNLIHLFSGDETIAFNMNRGVAISKTPSSINIWNGIADFIEIAPEIAAIPEPQGIQDPQASQNPQGSPNQNENRNSEFSIEEFEVSVSPPVLNENSVLGRANIIALASGSYVIEYQNKDTVYFLGLDSNFQRNGFEKEYQGYWFSEMIPAKGGGFYIALGKDINNTYIGGYPNTIFAGKLDSSGREEYLTRIFGGNGHGSLKAWFDGRSRAKLTEGNSELGVYFEVQKNWSETREEDIHNGDMFVVLNSRGQIQEDRTHFWTASHSSTIQTAFGSNGDFYTMTIGDAYPYGLQYYNRAKDRNWIIWPPEDDFVSYEEVNSTNAAGILEVMLPLEDGFIALMGTLEHPNIGVFDKVDVLFMKVDLEGNVTDQRWLTRTPGKDESVITAIPWGQDYLVAWGKGNDYDMDWEPANITLSTISRDGRPLIPAKEWDYPMGTYSYLTPGLDDSALWLYCDNGNRSIQIFQLRGGD
ncbi:MAG: hypothetical protein JEY99_04455 [Spirochaetales bacterium]|nr:hypothetical protein [Spirochaetales bacterium]